MLLIILNEYKINLVNVRREVDRFKNEVFFLNWKLIFFEVWNEIVEEEKDCLKKEIMELKNENVELRVCLNVF